MLILINILYVNTSIDQCYAKLYISVNFIMYNHLATKYAIEISSCYAFKLYNRDNIYYWTHI